MSSISSGLDPAAKYQRLGFEYVKIRNQVSVLKAALIEEQSKTADLQREMTVRDIKLRKVESERDSLSFRNDQLVKRVESLQESLESQLAIFEPGKGKKSHKGANLRLVAESSRMQSQQTLGGPSASDPQAVLEEELERKILENSVLHSKLFDVERRSNETTNELLQRIDVLQHENAALRNSNCSPQNSNSSVKSPVQNVSTATIDLNGKARNVSSSNNIATSQDCGGGCSNFGEQLSNSEMDINSSEGKPSDSAISVDSVEHSDTENGDLAAKRRLLEEYYTERISTLTKSLQHATGRATYYKQECEELIRKNITDSRLVDDLQSKNRELEDKCALLHETLEITQQNYSEQMSQLHEYMAERDEKMAVTTANNKPRQ